MSLSTKEVSLSTKEVSLSTKDLIKSLKEKGQWVLRDHGADILIHKSGAQIWMANGFWHLEMRDAGRAGDLKFLLKLRVMFALCKYFISWLNLLVFIPSPSFIWKWSIRRHTYEEAQEFVKSGSKLYFTDDVKLEAVDELISLARPELLLLSPNAFLRAKGKEMIKEKEK